MELSQRVVESRSLVGRSRDHHRRLAERAEEQVGERLDWPVLDRAGLDRSPNPLLHHLERTRFEPADRLPAQRRGRVEEEDSLGARLLAGLDEGGGAGLEGLPWILAALVGGDDRLGEPLLLAGVDRREQIPLAGNVVVERALRHPGLGDDSVQRGRRVAVLSEQPARSLDQ